MVCTWMMSGLSTAFVVTTSCGIVDLIGRLTLDVEWLVYMVSLMWSIYVHRCPCCESGVGKHKVEYMPEISDISRTSGWLRRLAWVWVQWESYQTRECWRDC